MKNPQKRAPKTTFQKITTRLNFTQHGDFERDDFDSSVPTGTHRAICFTSTIEFVSVTVHTTYKKPYSYLRHGVKAVIDGTKIKENKIVVCPFQFGRRQHYIIPSLQMG